MNSTSQIGHVSSVGKITSTDFSVGTRSYIPGYMGYIPHVRAENMFGRTYGNLTQIANDPQASKNFAYNQGRVTLTSKDTFFNQKNGNKTGTYPTGMSQRNKTIRRNLDEISDNKKISVNLTARETQAKAYGF